MKRLAIGLAVALGAVGLVLGIALASIDTQAISQLAAARASEALGREVQLGHVRLSLLPPGVRVRNVRIAGGPGEPELAQIGDIELGLALAPLLRGALELDSLSLDTPRIELPMGPDGLPALPRIPAEPNADRDPAAEPEPPAASDPAPDPEEAESSPLAISIQRFEIEAGELRSGPWAIRALELDGQLESLKRATASLSAEIENVGRIALSEIEVGALTGPEPRVRLAGSLEGIALAELLRRLPEPPENVAIRSGRLSGPFSAELAGGAVRAGRADWELAELDAEASGIAVQGGASLTLALGERFAIDLGAARIHQPGVLLKPAGDRLTVSGPLGARPEPAALTQATLQLGEVAVPLQFDLAGEAPHVELGPTQLDLAALAPWVEAAPAGLGGHIRSEGLRIALTPLGFDGALELDAVSIGLAQGSATLSGAVQAQGQRLVAQGLAARIADQELRISGSYALDPAALDLQIDSQGFDLEPALAALRGEASELTGRLGTQIQIQGPPDPAALQARGELRIEPGRIRGFSLVRQFLGRFADVATALARARGADLSRYEDEEFRELSAKFRASSERIEFESLRLEYRAAVAQLRGQIALPSTALGLRGELILRRELGAELSGDAQTREQVIPIEGIGGTLSQPRLELSRGALVALAARLAAGGRAGGLAERATQELEERVGPEGAEALQNLLQGVLGGGRRRPAPDDPDDPEPPASSPPGAEPGSGEPTSPPPGDETPETQP